MTTGTFEKTIRYDKESRDYRASLDGRLIGWFETYHAAEVELDRVVYDLLANGDCATATELDGGASDDDTPEPTEVNWNSYHEAADAGAFGPQASTPPSDPPPDDAPGEDIDGVPYPYMHMPEGDILDADGMRVTFPICYGMRVTFPICCGCNTSEYPPSALQSHFCTECVNAMLHGLPNRYRAAEEAAKLAHTRQSLAIEATMRRCKHCDGPHFTWRCPEIGDRLFAPDPPDGWKDVALGRELFKMRRHHAKFVQLLRNLPPANLVMHADSYVAFIHDCNRASDLTRQDVLKVWARWIGADRLAA